MNLKELLGDLFTEEIEAKLKGKELVLKSDQEGMIPKERFDKVNNERKEFKAKVDEYQNEIEKLSKSGQDVEELKNQLSLKAEEFTKYQESIEKEKINTKKTNAIIDALKLKNAINPKLLVREFDLEKVSFDDEGKLVGVKDTFDKLTVEYAQQFGKENTQSAKPNLNGEGGGISKEVFSKYSYKERVALREENPELYDTLIK